ncbi:MAG: membrane protein insertase YidC, partial [Betaproteobacteria bacterium]
MDAPRLVLLVIFCVSLFLLGEKWVKEYGPQAVSSDTAAVQRAAGDLAPVPDANRSNEVASHASIDAVPTVTTEATALPGAQTVRVRTDLMAAEISTIGGDIRRIELLTHRDGVDLQRNLVILDASTTHTAVAQTGLLGASMPNHKTMFVAERGEVALA